MTIAERYAWLRARHRCVGCTKPLPDEWKKARCQSCHSKQLAADRHRHAFLRDLAKRVETLEACVASLVFHMKQSAAIVKENNTMQPKGARRAA